MIGNLHPWAVIEVRRDLNRRKRLRFIIRSHHKTRGAAMARAHGLGGRVVRTAHLPSHPPLGVWGLA